jgi:prepilin-type N-terminal cleavage/methylation domain-containing protein
MRRGRRGFTIVETMFAVALFAFAVAAVGPLLARVARQSTVISDTQRRTAVVSQAASRAAAYAFDNVTAGCVVDSTGPFPTTACTTLTDTAGSLRRVQVIVTPADTVNALPDTIVLYRVDTDRVNPFNYP